MAIQVDVRRWRLDNLPTELLDKICAFFCAHCSLGSKSRTKTYRLIEERKGMRRDLRSLCLVARGVCVVAQPLLFHAMYHPDFWPFRALRGWPQYIVPFLRAIIGRPELGASVREVEFPIFSFRDYDESLLGRYREVVDEHDGFLDETVARPFGADDIRTFEDARERLGLPPFDWSLCGEDIGHIGQAKGDELFDLLAVLLVGHTPNIRHLDLPLDSDCGSLFQTISDARGGWPMLKTLKCQAKESCIHTGDSPLRTALLKAIVPILRGSPSSQPFS